MLVSTVVPTRNRSLELKRALDSIARQTHRDMEVIVVDDASTPENTQANKGFVDAAGARSAYVFSPADSGPAQTRNVGIKCAKGDLVAFCDDDYWYDDEHLATAVRAFLGDSSGVDPLSWTLATAAASAIGCCCWMRRRSV